MAWKPLDTEPDLPPLDGATVIDSHCHLDMDFDADREAVGRQMDDARAELQKRVATILTPEQKALIPKILSGDIIPATAVSEPDHGSDVAGIRTNAVREGNGWRLNGTKAWVTLGGIADRIMVFARTGAEAGHGSISCLLVDGALTNRV